MTTSTTSEPTGPGCERPGDGALAEPVSALTSLAFVVAAVLVLARGRRTPRLLGYAALVAGVGAGSFVQHGPDPAWSDVAHDLPLVGVLAFVAADAAGGSAGRRPRWWWWAAPAAAVLVLVVAAPRAGDLAQVAVAGLAVVLTVARAAAVPDTRRATAVALALLAVGGAIGTLSRTGGPLCDPDSLWQGHGLWHLLASAALVVLAPPLGRRRVRP